MNVVHIHLLGPYTDGWGYQENVLPEIQVRQGHNVTVITVCETHCPDNSIIEIPPTEYVVNGVKIIRIKYKRYFPSDRANKILFHYPLMKHLKKMDPEIILLHGLGHGLTNIEIKRFIKNNPKCELFGDVHTFAGNSEKAKGIKAKIVEYYANYCRNILYPYYKKVLCISQQCIDYAKDVYKISEDKLQLFPLGYDPNIVKWEQKREIRAEFRKMYNIGMDEIIIIHGGKIIPRRKTEMAVEIVAGLKHKVKLVVFGAIDDSIKNNIMNLFNSCSKIIYLGHLSKDDYIKAYLSSDIALFPGAQSSLWEEAIGCGLPLLINSTEKKDAMYFDRGGNVKFSDEDTAESFIKELDDMITTEKYKEMASVATTVGRDFFSYERISNLMFEEK